MLGGDGSQEVFRREVEFVRSLFDERYGTRGRSVALVNSRNTVATAPMATVSTIGEALKAIAARMDRDEDILFLFLTSHGSRNHSLTLQENYLALRDLPAAELAKLVKESGIRWKVIVVSACYSGGFIEPLKDDSTLIITASRADRTSSFINREWSRSSKRCHALPSQGQPSSKGASISQTRAGTGCRNASPKKVPVLT